MSRNGLKRIIVHWSAGTYNVSSIDKRHYHVIVDRYGKSHIGDLPPEANTAANVKSGKKYAAHTRRFNSGSIGVAVAAMAGATEKDEGAYPITKEQLLGLATAVADLCQTYGIKVSPSTVVMHSEVQVRFGVRQRGKWDISWLPGLGLMDAKKAGDIFRKMVIDELEGSKPAPVKLNEMETDETFMSFALALWRWLNNRKK